MGEQRLAGFGPSTAPFRAGKLPNGSVWGWWSGIWSRVPGPVVAQAGWSEPPPRGRAGGASQWVAARESLEFANTPRCRQAVRNNTLCSTGASAKRALGQYSCEPFGPPSGCPSGDALAMHSRLQTHRRRDRGRRLVGLLVLGACQKSRVRTRGGTGRHRGCQSAVAGLAQRSGTG